MSEREILSVLLADPQETLSTLVTKSERLFRVNRRNGDTILLSPRSRFLDRHLLAIYLLGRYFALKLGLAKDDELTIEELQMISGVDPGSLSARLSDLKKEGLIDSPERGRYRVDYRGFDSFSTLLDEVEQSFRGNTPIAKRELGEKVSSYLGIDFGKLPDSDAVLLALQANHAGPGTENRISADEIFEWLHSQGSFVKKDTLKKYTLPQHPDLKALLSKTPIGKQLRYQLSRPGMERAVELTAKLEAAST